MFDPHKNHVQQKKFIGLLKTTQPTMWKPKWGGGHISQQAPHLKKERNEQKMKSIWITVVEGWASI